MDHEALLKLMDEVAEESERNHLCGKHEDCLVCEVAEAISKSFQIKDYLFESVRDLIGGDASTLIATMAGVFCAGAKFESERAVMAVTEGKLP